MKPYPAYKESTIEWLDEIPAHWQTKRLKFLAHIKTGEKDTIDREEDGLYPLFVRSQTVERINTYAYDEEAVLTAGDGVGVAKVFHYINGKFDYHQRVYKISDFEEILGKYFYYFIKANLYEEVIKISAKSTVDSLRLPMFQNFPVVFGDIQEQQAIVDYLDRKTAVIDTLIAKKERQIELLQEQRTAVINHAVTKGLNPHAPLKDSGIPWLGQIPAHWELVRLKYLGEDGLTNGIFKKKDQFGKGVKLVNVMDVYQDDFTIKPDELDRVEADENEIEKYSVFEGDIFFVRSSLKLEGTGVSAHMQEVNEPTVFECHVVRLRPNKDRVNSKYLINFLNSESTRKRLLTLVETVTMSTISQPKISSIEVTLPSIDEQNLIVDHLERQTKIIFETIRKHQEQIKLLQEYRTAVISAAVTGKIDVRSSS